MAKIGAVLDRISWPMAIMLALFVGLAPFVPEPHIWQKLQMLVTGNLSRPVDMFDLFLHGTPWLILAGKISRRVSAGDSGE